jgi:hypothetical protein
LSNHQEDGIRSTPHDGDSKSPQLETPVIPAVISIVRARARRVGPGNGWSSPTGRIPQRTSDIEAQTTKRPLGVYFLSHVVMVVVLELPSPGKRLD